MMAILKEYEFTSGQVAIELKDGESSEHKAIAKRVAFSAYG